jgi:hypothetical protein
MRRHRSRTLRPPRRLQPGRGPGRLHRWALVTLATTVALAVGGCGDDDSVTGIAGGESSAGDGVAELRVIADEAATGEPAYRFELPDRIDAGPTRIALSNRGEEEHHAQVLRLDEGATVDDLTAALAAGGPPAALEVGTFAGGTALVAPGEDSRADAVVDLAPGDHVLLCFVADAEGTPHVAHGMVRPFAVGEAGADTPPPPAADLDVELADFRIELPDTVAGEALLAIANAADAEAHEMVVARLDEGATARDVVAALDRREPLPATGVGGMQALPPGAAEHVQLDLEDGEYVVFCAVPSPDGVPHYAKGMIAEVGVR